MNDDLLNHLKEFEYLLRDGLVLSEAEAKEVLALCEQIMGIINERCKGRCEMTYQRKTVDEWRIYGDYGQGWEEVTCEDTREKAKAPLKCYNENEPHPHTIKKCRVKR